MDKQTLKEIVVPGGISAILVATACYMAIVGQEVPSWLYGFVGISIGYFFNAGPNFVQRIKKG